jgi:predicted nucleic acid-binding protein
MAVALDEAEREAIIASTQSAELLAPEVLPYEIGNALSSLFRRGLLSSSQMQAAWSATQQIPVEYRIIDIRHALEIAAQHRIYAYDAYFLECALQTRSPLLTLDRKMRAVAELLKIELINIGEP